MQRYELKVKYLPGSELSVADASSKSYQQVIQKLSFQTL